MLSANLGIADAIKEAFLPTTYINIDLLLVIVHVMISHIHKVVPKRQSVPSSMYVFTIVKV